MTGRGQVTVVTCTHFGELMADEGRAARQLTLVETDSAQELETWPALPSRHFVCLVVWDA